MKPGNFRKPGRQIPPIAVARFGLRRQSVQLRVENRALEFTQTIVARNDVVFVPNAAFNATAIVDRPARARQRIVVDRDDTPSPAVMFLLD